MASARTRIVGVLASILLAPVGVVALVTPASADTGKAYIVNKGSVTIAVCRSASSATSCNWDYLGGGAAAHKYLAPGHSSAEFGWDDTDGFFCGAGYHVTISSGGPTYTCSGSGLPPNGSARFFKVSGSLNGHLNVNVYPFPNN